MPTLDPRVLDVALHKIIDDTTDLCLCVGDPGLSWSAFEVAEVASVAAPPFGEIEAIGNGRRVPVLPFSSGKFVASGIATCYALVDRDSEFVLLTRPLSASVTGAAGQSWGITAAFYITFPGPA